MKLKEVIDRALSDKEFAQQLRAKALAGLRAGIGTDAWESFMAYFAENPRELANLRTLTSADDKCTTRAATTTTVDSTAACTTTTTTTTTSLTCH